MNCFIFLFILQEEEKTIQTNLFLFIYKGLLKIVIFFFLLQILLKTDNLQAKLRFAESDRRWIQILYIVHATF